MRIDDILKQQAVHESQEQKTQKSSGQGNDFAMLLQNEVSGAGQQSAPQDLESSLVSGLENAPGLWGIESMNTATAQPYDLSQPMGALDDTLSQLEGLENSLQNDKSPKEINALIDQLNTQIAGLDGKMSGLPADHPLRSIAEEAKVTAYMESIRWNRGDYL